MTAQELLAVAGTATAVTVALSRVLAWLTRGPRERDWRNCFEANREWFQKQNAEWWATDIERWNDAAVDVESLRATIFGETGENGLNGDVKTLRKWRHDIENDAVAEVLARRTIRRRTEGR